MSLDKIKRFARFAFYLTLGGWAALVSACSESTDGHRGDAAPPADSGKSQQLDAGQSRADAGRGDTSIADASTRDASIRDASKDAAVAEGGKVRDSSPGAADGGEGGAMWDVICE
jgi:hypothetical protein